MIAPGTPFDELAESHLRDLLTAGVREGRGLEFKEALPGGTDEAKREFLADASSLANAGGGDLVFGIRDVEGVASKIVPLTADADGEVLRLDGILRTGIEPRLLGIQTRRIRVDGGWALVIRVPASWTGPHAARAKSQGSYRFFSRTSAGKYPLDVGEIRSAFVSADATGRRVRDWQADRLGRIVARETPVPLRVGPMIVLHIAPISPGQQTSPGAVEGSGILGPLALTADVLRWNVDGMVAFASDGEGQAFGYAQLFRDGHFEAVNAVALEWLKPTNACAGAIHGAGLERAIIDGVANPLRALQIAGASPPFVVLVALIGVRGMEIIDTALLPRLVRAPIDRDVLLAPDVVCESFDWNRAREMRPIVDALWQSSGWSKSPSYTAIGEWHPAS